MKVINSKLAAIGLAAFVFASCSDSNSDPTGPTPNVELAETITANLTSSSAAELAARVSNYKNTTANARKFFFSRATQTRAFAYANNVTIPAVPEGARQWSSAEDMTAGKTYLITSKTKLDMSGHNVAGTTIFVKGNSKLIFNSSIAGCTIYVDGGATLEYKGEGALEIPANTTIINDGGSIVVDKDITVAGKLYVRTPNNGGGIGSVNPYDKNNKKAIITPKHNITFKQGSEAYIGGSLHAVKLNIEEGATVNVTKHIMNATTVNVNGALQFGGFLRTETLNVKGEMIASEKSAIKASKVFNAEAGSRITADYINVTNDTKDATLNLKGNCQININNKSDIYTNNIVTDNASAGQITLNDDNAIAVIKAKKFTNNGDNQIKALATSGNNATFLLQFTECYTGTTKENTFEDLALADVNFTFGFIYCNHSLVALRRDCTDIICCCNVLHFIVVICCQCAINCQCVELAVCCNKILALCATLVPLVHLCIEDSESICCSNDVVILEVSYTVGIHTFGLSVDGRNLNLVSDCSIAVQ
jgi:hypothetical protein